MYLNATEFDALVLLSKERALLLRLKTRGSSPKIDEEKVNLYFYNYNCSAYSNTLWHSICRRFPATHDPER